MVRHVKGERDLKFSRRQVAGFMPFGWDSMYSNRMYQLLEVPATSVFSVGSKLLRNVCICLQNHKESHLKDRNTFRGCRVEYFILKKRRSKRRLVKITWCLDSQFVFSTKCDSLLWRDNPTRARATSFLRFADHTEWHITVGRTPLDE
jgi:hypothetical protein